MTMTKLIRRSLALTTLAAATLGVAACSGDVGGTPTPSSTTSDAPSTTAANPLASLDPCSLLTQDSLTQLGITVTGPDNTAKSRGCKWQKHGQYSIGIYLDGSQPIDTVGTDGASKVTLQSHDAVQTSTSGFGCDVEIAISTSASVDVIASSTPNDCQVAQNFAGLIESKLPAQQR